MKFEKGDKIEIFGDYFIVDQILDSEILLRTKDESILLSKIILEKTQKILMTERVIDTKMEKKGFRLNGKNYQIINQRKMEEYDGNKWTQIIKSDVQLIGEKDKYPRKILEKKNKRKIFQNWEKLLEKDIIFNPVENFEKQKNTNNKKIKIKIKDLP